MLTWHFIISMLCLGFVSFYAFDRLYNYINTRIELGEMSLVQVHRIVSIKLVLISTKTATKFKDALKIPPHRTHIFPHCPVQCRLAVKQMHTLILYSFNSVQ